MSKLAPKNDGILEIHQIPVLEDNYIYLARDPLTDACAVIDPALTAPVMETLDALGWKLTHILNTHHHGDHIGGNMELKNATGCTIVGPRADAARIPGIDVKVGDGDTYDLGGQTARVFDVPGHTRGHIAYWFEDSGALFCGDTLFALGCGRMFEGNPQQFWTSLSKLRALPDETRVYCAHEYTSANADFALSVDPDNSRLKTRADEILRRRQDGKPTVPSVLGEEKATNPFLRADVADFQLAMGMAGRDPVEVFAETRQRKDNF